MTNEIDELIWRVLDGCASSDEIRFLLEWVKRDENNRSHFYQLKKIWNIASGPKLSRDRKSKELKRFLNFMQRASGGPNHFFHFIRWAKYAAILVISLGISLHYILRQEVRDENGMGVIASDTIRHGEARAILTMADGETVLLQRYQPIDIQLGGQIRVSGSGKSISYEDFSGSTTSGDSSSMFSDVCTLFPSNGEEGSGRIFGSICHEIYVPRCGEYQLQLSDGTRVYLNAKSKLRYPVCFTGSTREVELDGEAYFVVAKDVTRRFIVHTSKMVVSVLGTEFNISAYADEVFLTTTLVNGSVQVNTSGVKESFRLKPNEQFSLNKENQEMTVMPVDVSSFTAWKEGMFCFRDVKLEDITRTIERWYDVEVIYEDEEVKELEFGFNMSRNETIDPLLRVFEINGKVKIEREGKRLKLSKGR